MARKALATVRCARTALARKALAIVRPPAQLGAQALGNARYARTALARKALAITSILLHSFGAQSLSYRPTVRTVLARQRKNYSQRYARTAIWHDKAIATVNDTPAQLFGTTSHSYRQRYAHTAMGHDKAIATVNDTPARLWHGKATASPIRSLDFVYVKAWLTLATVSPSVHLVRNTKTRPSLSHQLARLYTTKLPTPISTSTLPQCSPRNDSLLWTAPAMQHLVHVMTRCYGLPKHCNIWLTYDSLYELATKSTHPRLTQRTVKTGTLIYQTRPTSATCNDRPAAFNDSTDISFPQRSSSCIQRPDRSQLTRIKHLAVSPRLDLRQLPSSNVELRTSTTRPYQLSTSPI